MPKQILPVLPMSQIIAHDAPLLSPVSSEFSWGQQQQQQSPTATAWDPLAMNLNYAQYAMPPSPPMSVHSIPSCADSPTPTSRMLKTRLTSPDSSSDSDNQQLCLPTHQLFDFPVAGETQTDSGDSPSPSSPEAFSPAPSSPAMGNHSLPDEMSVSTGSKRPSIPIPGESKKPRASASRISVKDFVPPDVSGLSKREARLVKNRAAAFLSRQRKREEFELMEVRVAELEQENARLLALSQQPQAHTPAQPTPPPPSLLSEVEQLRAQLAAAEQRSLQLSAQLQSSLPPTPVPIVKVKSESVDHRVPSVTTPSTPSRASSSQPTHNRGASLGLMVLLCALPTLLSMPAHSGPTQQHLPTTYSFPGSSSSSSSSSSIPLSSFDNLGSFNLAGDYEYEYDWTRASSAGGLGLGNSLMDLDWDLGGNGDIVGSSGGVERAATGVTRKLDLDLGAAGEELGLGLKGLDISFDATPSEDGKIRVRIHPPSSSSSSSSASTSSSSSSTADPWSPPSESAFDTLSYPSSSSTSPFLGIGHAADSLSLAHEPLSLLDGFKDSSMMDLEQSDFFMGGAAAASTQSSGTKRRVRIALKSLPKGSGEGGEWEVELC
ncbi:hypothetical protein JAAARDRAFT_196106 [Jaapia argillacea MUCL 33604]|uniref:BZIP domain-containing protein n=1 Tax=Jaapia argillacea MUCL 33604 TaxID=933084 RepID=A0A067PK26_9AGAM|nr:hypothetical protein JAAARDRAFT_196106 [Jaapia argillacea MUCL 33604]